MFFVGLLTHLNNSKQDETQRQAIFVNIIEYRQFKVTVNEKKNYYFSNWKNYLFPKTSFIIMSMLDECELLKNFKMLFLRAFLF